MKKFFYPILSVFLLFSFSFSYNGEIVKKREVNLKRIAFSIKKRRKVNANLGFIKKVNVYAITYLSDGLKVKGFLSIPKEEGLFPVVIYNRGGNKNFGAITPYKVLNIIARISSWGYVVVASQYRGNMGGEGKEEFGGKDVNDILNLIPLVKGIKKADSSKTGIFGWSRGGMMTYLVLKKTNMIKAAVVGGGLSDLFMMMESRPEMEDVYKENIPGYNKKTREKLLKERSAVYWADKISKTTPVLMLHGTADWRVIPRMSLKLANEFLKVKQPFRLIMFEGGDHALSEFDKEVFYNTKLWFKRFLKDNEPLPNLTPHGD